jgi:hypothetical protein
VNIFTTGQVQVAFGQNVLGLGFIYGAQAEGQPLPPEPSFADGPSAMLLARSNAGGGSRIRNERVAPSLDEEAYLQEHIAPLRRSVPKQLGGRTGDVEEVVLVRVGGSRLRIGLLVQGAPPT